MRGLTISTDSALTFHAAMSHRPPPTDKKDVWLPVALIAGALVIWAVFLAVGAYLAPGGDEGGHDGRKLLVVAITTGGFLVLWGLVLLVRHTKARRKRQQLQNDDY